MFMHCSHVSFIDAHQVFDKMPKWHFGVVLDSNEFQTLGITMIGFVYHVLIISFDQNVLSHALHMHHICTPHARLMHTLAYLSCFCISIMLGLCYYMFSSHIMIL